VFASDARDVAGSACAGINDSDLTVPAGYQIYSFVSFTFPDGKIVSAGWVKTSGGRLHFGSIQNRDGSGQAGNLAAPGSLAAGSHTFCVTHGSGGWTATDDGATIFTTLAEGAVDSSRGSVQFHTSVSRAADSTAPTASFSLLVPGFHDIVVGAKAPTQLAGQTAIL
jgi:hypothetical protein